MASLEFVSALDSGVMKRIDGILMNKPDLSSGD
jgi:hypothetical protein